MIIRTALREFAAYLANPRLIVPVGLNTPGERPRWLVMAGLYLAGLVVIGALLSIWVRLLPVSAPEAFAGHSPWLLVLLVVAIAPPCEEALFRGWLTGRPRALWLVAMALVVAALCACLVLHVAETAAALGVIATGVAAITGWWRLRHLVDPPRRFVAGYRISFALSVMVFAALHLTNYAHPTLATVPMVLPQMWAGLVFGYVRMRQGLGASIALHATGNAAMLTAALLSGILFH